MIIERDASIYLRNEVLDSQEDREQKKDIVISAMKLGNKVLLPPLRPVDLLSSYFHEIGHFISEQLSFVSNDVLTPDEAKETRLDLSFKETLYLVKTVFYGNRPMCMNDRLLQSANKFLNVYTKGNFDVDPIIVQNVSSKEELLEIFKEKAGKGNASIELAKNGELKAISSREGRNTELSAIITELGCLSVLENSMSYTLRWLLDDFNFHIYTYPGNTNYQRAYNIVHQAYKGTGWTLPSLLDIDGKH